MTRSYRKWTPEEDAKLIAGEKVEGRCKESIKTRRRILGLAKKQSEWIYSEMELAMLRLGIVPPGRPHKSAVAKARMMGIKAVFSERLWKPCEIEMIGRRVCPRNRSLTLAYKMRRHYFGSGDGITKHRWKMESPAAFRERMK